MVRGPYEIFNWSWRRRPFCARVKVTRLFTAGSREFKLGEAEAKVKLRKEEGGKVAGGATDGLTHPLRPPPLTMTSSHLARAARRL